MLAPLPMPILLIQSAIIRPELVISRHFFHLHIFEWLTKKLLQRAECLSPVVRGLILVIFVFFVDIRILRRVWHVNLLFLALKPETVGLGLGKAIFLDFLSGRFFEVVEAVGLVLEIFGFLGFLSGVLKWASGVVFVVHVDLEAFDFGALLGWSVLVFTEKSLWRLFLDFILFKIIVVGDEIHSVSVGQITLGFDKSLLFFLYFFIRSLKQFGIIKTLSEPRTKSLKFAIFHLGIKVQAAFEAFGGVKSVQCAVLVLFLSLVILGEGCSVSSRLGTVGIFLDFRLNCLQCRHLLKNKLRIANFFIFLHIQHLDQFLVKIHGIFTWVVQFHELGLDPVFCLSGDVVQLFVLFFVPTVDAPEEDYLVCLDPCGLTHPFSQILRFHILLILLKILSPFLFQLFPLLLQLIPLLLIFQLKLLKLLHNLIDLFLFVLKLSLLF